MEEEKRYLRTDGVFNLNPQSEKLFKKITDDEGEKKRIEEQFREIVAIPVLDVDELGKNPRNKKKNRYGDVLPLKKTVVRLSRVNNDFSSEYINANFIQDVTRENDIIPQKYISTQAPLPFTFSDFWRMIWENNVVLIVMLTNLVERNKEKADMYWPRYENCSISYGKINVKLIKERKKNNSITIRYMDVWYQEKEEENSVDDMSSGGGGSQDDDGGVGLEDSIKSESHSNDSDESPQPMEINGKNVKRIVQVHCTEWPDFGVPNSTEILKEIINEVDNRKKGPSDPILVHCSAGIGRTGTFIAIHMSLQSFSIDKHFDIKETVINLRKQRLGMVQSLEQYMSIYEVVSEIIEDKDTISKKNSKTILNEENPKKKSTKKE